MANAAQVCFAPRKVLAVVFDGDDTLWSTEQLYDDARSRAARIVGEAGLDPVEWAQRERHIDVANVAKLGYSVERFPASCVQAYEELCSNSRRPINLGTLERIRRAAATVFEHDAPLVPGAKEMLTTLRARGARLALLTKGDPGVQMRRLEHSGLRDLFHVVKIVPEKSPAVIRDVVTALGASISSAWMVGNSIRSDVAPALRAGLRAVWIDAHVWEYEQGHDLSTTDGVITAAQIADVPSLITA
jgi:putative hydrolase of the HAD superfamily